MIGVFVLWLKSLNSYGASLLPALIIIRITYLPLFLFFFSEIRECLACCWALFKSLKMTALRRLRRYMYNQIWKMIAQVFPRHIIAAAVSEPEANERGSSLISRRLHCRGLQSLFLSKRKELWLCANGRFRMRSGMLEELWLCANGKILGCAVIWRKELWLCANGWFRMRSEPCAFLSWFSLFAYILQIGYLKDCNVAAHSLDSDIVYVVINLSVGSESYIITFIY